MMRSPATLILFDIDGTLMITGGAGSRAILSAGRQVFGASFDWGPITVGLLDPQIYAQLAEHNAVADPAAHHDAYYTAYLAALDDELERHAADIKVMPGVHDLLARLHGEADTTLGIVSGNYAAAARRKLRAAGLPMEWLVVTAYAEDGVDRAALVAVAIERCERQTGRRVRPERVVVVGDTPRDVACAHANGCRCLAVATGRYDERALAEAGADRVVSDLTDPATLPWLSGEAC